ncbi:MAG: HEAT repeat domain-containing protein [Planctomycetota bacterium]|nr:HEAT repeat domain-containing protein [Planctomycetota bacterium]
MNEPAPPADAPQDREVLPPVEQPSAGFIIQLFVIPGMIVLLIVLLWLGFSWLAHRGTQPEEIVRQMRQNKANSWQLAYNFSEELRQNETYRTDQELANEVAAFLNDLLDQPLPPKSENGFGGTSPRSQEIARRGFLCKALGEFLVPETVLPVLIRAASNHADDDELRVRLAAIEAIALLVENTHTPGTDVSPELLALLLANSENDDRKIASRAVVALAATGQPEATSRLEEMLTEAHHVDVIYNVATGLARLGNTACLETLEEMLDPNNERALSEESNPSERELKRLRILLNALRATQVLRANNPQTNLQPLEPAIQTLQATEKNPQIQMEAELTIQSLQDPVPAASSSSE